MSNPWAIKNFKRLAPSDLDFVWATFDVEFNGVGEQLDVKLLQQGDGFQISPINASVDTAARVTQEALRLALKAEPE